MARRSHSGCILPVVLVLGTFCAAELLVAQPSISGRAGKQVSFLWCEPFSQSAGH